MRFQPLFPIMVVLSTSPVLAAAQSPLSFEINQNTAKTGLASSISGVDGAVQADFNNDGKPDLITTDALGSNLQAFNLRLGNGDGTFQAPMQIASVTTTTYGQFTNLLAVDLNGDGKLDIVASGYGTQQIEVLFASGNGFQQPLALPISSEAYAGAVTGDFNSDTLMDIAVGDSNGNVEIFQNTGNQNFVLARTIPVASGSFIYTLAAGDVDSDGRTDLAMTDGGNNARILWGLGNNDFRPAILNSYPLVNSVSTFATIGDVNQDGSADVLITYDCNPVAAVYGTKGPTARCAGIDVYYGGQGQQTTFYRHAVEDGTVSTALNLAPVDVNGDGIADLVAEGLVGSNTQTGVAVWLGNPDGSFAQTARQFLAASGGAGQLIAGDFNRDGMMDFLLTGVAGIYLNATPRAACATSRINSTVMACQPVDNSYIAGPNVRVQATTYDKLQVTALQEYIDDRLFYSQPETTLDMQFPVSLGTHLFVTKGWNSNGVNFRTNRHVTVYDGTPGAVCAAAPNAASLCLPAGPIVQSPVRILANGATSAVPTAVQLYVDGTLAVNDTTHSTVLDVDQTLSSGAHQLVFKLFDANGGVLTATKTITVQ